MATRPIQNEQGAVSDKYLNQYTVSSHQYPNDLDTSPEYGGNKVIFFINVSGDGKFAKSESGKKLVRDVPKSEFESRPVESVKKDSEIVQSAGEKLGVPTQPMKRLTSAISLYVPNELSTSYNAEWGEEDMLNLDLIARGIDPFTSNAPVGMVDRLKKLGEVAKDYGTSKVLGGSSYIEKATRTTPGQSKMEQLFRRVNFRDFSFMYQFAPRDEYEADNVMNIIRTFRHHMLPEFKDTNQFLYIYPSEFEIAYYRGDEQNPFLEKHFTAVLTNMSVNYTPNGVFTTFPNGMPTQINMSLSFRELSVATKETSPFDRSGI